MVIHNSGRVEKDNFVVFCLFIFVEDVAIMWTLVLTVWRNPNAHRY